MPICIGPAAPNAIGPAVHAGQGRAALVGLHLADPGQHRPRDAVRPPRLLVEAEVIGGDRRPPGGARRRLHRGGHSFRRPGRPVPEQRWPSREQHAAAADQPAPTAARPSTSTIVTPTATLTAVRPACVNPSRQFTSCLADASWMSFTCQPLPDRAIVIGVVAAGLVGGGLSRLLWCCEVFWLSVTRKVKLDSAERAQRGDHTAARGGLLLLGPRLGHPGVA